MMALNVQCKKCANLRNDWCKLVVDSPDPDMVRDCQYYMGKTNADKIRQMSDEELAYFIGGIFTIERDMWGDYDPRTVVTQEPRVEVRNKEEMLEWLKQEVESDA